MRSPSWEDMHNQLSSAGLIVQTSAVEKLEKLQNVLPLIEAANSSGVRLLNGATVDELLANSKIPLSVDFTQARARFSSWEGPCPYPSCLGPNDPQAQIVFRIQQLRLPTGSKRS